MSLSKAAPDSTLKDSPLSKRTRGRERSARHHLPTWSGRDFLCRTKCQNQVGDSGLRSSYCILWRFSFRQDLCWQSCICVKPFCFVFLPRWGWAKQMWRRDPNGTTRSSTCWLVSALLWGLETSGVFPTCAKSMEEVSCNNMTQHCPQSSHRHPQHITWLLC